MNNILEKPIISTLFPNYHVVPNFLVFFIYYEKCRGYVDTALLDHPSLCRRLQAGYWEGTRDVHKRKAGQKKICISKF